MSALFSAAGPSTQLPQPGLSAAALAPGAKLAIFLVNDEAMTNYLNEQFLR